MPVTREVFEAFLKCPTKSYLRSKNVVGVYSEFGEWQQHVQERFKQAACRQFCSSVPEDELHVGTPPLRALEDRRYHVITDYAVDRPSIQSRLHALKLARSDNDVGGPYIPIRFIPRETLTAADKLLLAFDALALSQASGKMPRIGRIIHGPQYASVTVLLDGFLDKVRLIHGNIAAQQAEGTPPPLILNKHCGECEFQSRCRQIAIEKDDLSLLPNMTEKERRKQHDKGIFTVTQLSYTFRPRRRSGPAAMKYQHALKALAIRKNQIHILGIPALSAPGTPVYFDVEGVPDSGFYYLIGLRTASPGSSVQYSFWADNSADEQNMWAECLRRLSRIDSPRLIYYGSYETQFLKRMRARYPHIGNPMFLEQLTKSALNLLSVIYAHVYFPTYSNGLKDVARYLGFRWSDSTSSGLSALVWRFQWETSREPRLKEKLITYNAEDCAATQMVAEALSALCQTVSSEGTPKADVVNVDSLKREFPQRFGEVEFVLPEFRQINQAAYWNYQRNRIYVRSNRRLQRLSRETLKGYPKRELRPNKIIPIEEPRPVSCSHCNDPLIYKWGWFSQTVYDLRSSPAGIRRWVVRYLVRRYICWHCKATFHQYVRKPKYGPGLCAYLLYQIIEMHIPQNAVAKSVRQLFGLSLSRGVINHMKAREAGRYQATYRAILERISAGKLVHADETKVGINGKDGYAWVFTNLEEVAFIYSETRDSSTAQDVLRNFRGVLVSDFYAGYDSIDCAQQKCLIHLIRDMNDDLCKQPFNEEMKDLAQEFARLVKPMIETVDRFGLRARYLRKHKHCVERFYRALCEGDYQTEVAAGYRKRLEKNRDKLFTFLDHDGVPWNNNNAEHAIKALVRLRKSIGGKSSANGMRDYPVLLSICETCKCKGASFLDFLRSGEMDVETFANRS